MFKPVLLGRLGMSRQSRGSVAMEPQSAEELALRLETLRNAGSVESVANGSQSAGKTLEYYLRVDDSHSKFDPDLSTGIELKTVGSDMNTLMTLFTLEPSTKYRWGKELIDYYWNDGDVTDAENADYALHATLHANRVDSNGMTLDVAESGDIFVTDTKSGNSLARYTGNDLNHGLTQKFNYLMVVESKRKKVGLDRNDRDILFRYPDATYFSGIQTDAFRELVREGVVSLDIRMKVKQSGELRNHGTAWRINASKIPEMYESVFEVFDTDTEFASLPTPDQDVLIDREPVAAISPEPSANSDDSGEGQQMQLAQFKDRTGVNRQETLTSFLEA